MGEKIILLQTSIERENQSFTVDDNTTYPLGMAYLHSFLVNKGFNVLTKEYANRPEEECLKDIEKNVKEFKPAVVGFSVLTMTRVSTYKAIKLVRQIDKDIKIILGGVHASIMYEQLLNNFDIDAVVIGEGEMTSIELIPALLKNRPLGKIKGIAFKKNNKIIKTESRQLIPKLDEMPFPEHGLFATSKRTRFCFLSSRGCPNNCSFCCLDFLGRRVFRQRSVDNILAEIKYLIKKYPQIEAVEFSDDTFTLNEERVIEFCNKVTAEKINLKFVCSGRIKPASSRMFAAMEAAGFEQIRFGIESGSARILKSIHKNITKEEILNTFKLIAPFKKIEVVKMLIVGFPGETWADVNETIEFIKELQKYKPMNFFCVNPLWVFPGTEVYQIMKSKNKISDDYWLTEKNVPYYTVDYSLEELRHMANYIAIETAKGQGSLFFLASGIKRLIKYPRYYIKRIFNDFLPAYIYKFRRKSPISVSNPEH